MKLTTLAAVLLIILSLMNLPAGFASDLPVVLSLSVAALGIAGLVAAIAHFRHASWSGGAIAGVGAVNLVAAIVALVAGEEGAVIGLTFSIAIVAASLPQVVTRSRTSTPARA